MKKKEARVIDAARMLANKIKFLEEDGTPLVAQGNDSPWTLKSGYPQELTRLAESLDDLDKKKQEFIPLLEDFPAVEEEEYLTPAELSSELGITEKRLRSWLRSKIGRDEILKGTPWLISQGVADEARKRFA
jgi:hypothetical protein